MCNHCPPKRCEATPVVDRIYQVQDAFHPALSALEGLRDLLCEAERPGRVQFDGLGRAGLAALVVLVEARFAEAGRMLDEFARRSDPPRV